jgi:hypothetical protein
MKGAASSLFLISNACAQLLPFKASSLGLKADEHKELKSYGDLERKKAIG